MLEFIDNLLRTWRQSSGLPIWYDPDYRLPVSAAEGAIGIEPRRADFVAWFLAQTDAVRSTQLKSPRAVSFEHLQRVHTHEYLESLWEPEVLAGMLGLAPSQVPVDEVLRTVRLACGGTLAATRWVLDHRGPALNLMGGFHFAGPDFGSGLNPLSDVACALAAVRAEGFARKVVVIDLDAHSPKGLAACLADDPDAWIGSICIEGTEVDGVQVFCVPEGCDNPTYRRAFDELLQACPEAGLAFVIAGGDVLAGDRAGRMGLDLRGVRRRDLALARHLGHTPAVWLPGGGYHRDSWKALAGTGLVLTTGSKEPIPERYDPMMRRYAALSREFRPPDDDPEAWLTADDLADALRLPGSGHHKFLDTYTVEAIDFALVQFGILPHLRRLGYSQFRTVLDCDGNGDRLRLYGRAEGEEHLLVELVLVAQVVAGQSMLYVHWLTLRNPMADFTEDHRKLPGQDVPGLGLAQEAGELLIRIARRLNLAGIAYRPAWYHTAYAGRYFLRFVDPPRQGRFEALMRDLAQVPLLEATTALAEGRVTCNGEAYTWEADVMAFWLAGPLNDSDQVAAERERVRFALAD